MAKVYVLSGAVKASGRRNATRFFKLIEEVEARLACGGIFVEHGGVMRLRLHIRVLPGAAFLFAAGLFASASAAGQTAGQPTQTHQANPVSAPAAAAAVNVPAGAAVPAPVAPRIDDARSIPGFSPREIGNLTFPASTSAAGDALHAPVPVMQQNRVLPANVGNARNVNNASVQGTTPDSARARPAYSANWLIDGVRQLEAESRQRLNPAGQQAGIVGEKTMSGNGGGDNDDDNTRANTGRNSSASANTSASSAPASASTDNPLAAYLDKWITTPEGAAAARAATAPAQADAAPAVPADILLKRLNVEANIPWHADTAAAQTTFRPAASNPYIDDMFQPQMETKGLDIVLPPPPIPAPEAPKAAVPPAQNNNAPPATAPIDTSKLIIKPITPPPTAPVVDEKKYFPQLQRF